MSARANSCRQSVFLDPQTALDCLVVALLAGRIADERLVESSVLTPNASRFQVLALRRGDDHPRGTAFRRSEQADFRLEDVSNRVRNPLGFVKMRSPLAGDVHKALMRHANVVGRGMRRVPHRAALLPPVLVGAQ